MLANHFELEWSGYDGEDKPFIKLELEEAIAGKDTWFMNKEVYMLSRCPLPSRCSTASTASSSNTNHVIHPDFDLADPTIVADTLVPFNCISHVFYVVSYPRSGATEDEDRESNYDML